jgi:hypothetical protein
MKLAVEWNVTYSGLDRDPVNEAANPNCVFSWYKKGERIITGRQRSELMLWGFHVWGSFVQGGV